MLLVLWGTLTSLVGESQQFPHQSNALLSSCRQVQFPLPPVYSTLVMADDYAFRGASSLVALKRPTSVDRWVPFTSAGESGQGLAEIARKSPLPMSGQATNWTSSKLYSGPSWDPPEVVDAGAKLRASFSASDTSSKTHVEGQRQRRTSSHPCSAMKRHPFFCLIVDLHVFGSKPAAWSWLCTFTEVCIAIGAIPDFISPQQLGVIATSVGQQLPGFIPHNAATMMEILHVAMYSWVATEASFPLQWAEVHCFASAQFQTDDAVRSRPANLKALNHLLATLARRFLRCTPRTDLLQTGHQHVNRAQCPACGGHAGRAAHTTDDTTQGMQLAVLNGKRRARDVQSRSTVGGSGRWPDLLLQQIKADSKKRLPSLRASQPAKNPLKMTCAVYMHSVFGDEPISCWSAASGRSDALACQNEREHPTQTSVGSGARDGIQIVLESLRSRISRKSWGSQRQVASFRNTSTRSVRYLPHTGNPYAHLSFSAKAVAPGGHFQLHVSFQAQSRGEFTVDIEISRQHTDGSSLDTLTTSMQFKQA